MKKIVRYLPFFLYVAVVFFLILGSYFAPRKEFSEMENRKLQTWPALSFRDLISGSYTTGVEDYISDHFLGRQDWIMAKSISEQVVGKDENNGITIGADSYMFEKNTALDVATMERNLGYIIEFADDIPQENVWFTLVPPSSVVLSDKLPQGFPNGDEQAVLNSLYQTAQEGGLQVYNPTTQLLEQKEEYVYYRTDHHWTSTGAYLAYSGFVEELGLTPVSLEEYQANVVEDFYGTYYSKAQWFGTVPDELTWYDIPVEKIVIEGEEYPTMYDLEQFETRDKYAGFLYSNHGLTTIYSSTSHPNEDGTPSRILVFKDSYGNSFAPFLTNHFDEVVVVDLRYYRDVAGLLEQDYNAIYFLYSFANFSTDSNVAKLLLPAQAQSQA